MGCCGDDGTAGSGLERAQAAARLKALITGQVKCTTEVANRAREQRTGRKWLEAEEGLEGIWMEMKMGPPFFYRAVG